MPARPILIAALGLSGLTALVYQLIWTRHLGFTLGTSSEAVGLVLAIFFGGLAGGNALAARFVGRSRRPLLVYAGLELAIGLFALLSLPALENLAAFFAWVGADPSGGGGLVRALVAATLLLPPTLAMGATLPFVARGLVTEDPSLGRWTALLYAANTAGGVLGVYLCGFWWIPLFGLRRSVLLAVLLNLLVAAAAAAAGRNIRAETDTQPLPTTATGGSASPPERRVFLALFGLSGALAIGYEIAWAKLFAIVMHGTHYGFAAVLASYLTGIALGSWAVSGRVDRLRDLPLAFALAHLGVALSVALGASVVPYLPYLVQQLSGWFPESTLHLHFALVFPLLVVPTALFGAAFPILIRIYSESAATVGSGIGVATAVNTLGSIIGSLVLSFWWLPSFGIDTSLGLLLGLEFGIVVLVLALYAKVPRAARGSLVAGTVLAGLTLAIAFPGTRIGALILGRNLGATPDLASYGSAVDAELDRLVYLREGRSAVVTLRRGDRVTVLQTNGQSEGGLDTAPPYVRVTPFLLGALPYLFVDNPERAAVIGLGGAGTLRALLFSEIETLDVIELEAGVESAIEVLYRGRPNPLRDPRVRLIVNDGRNELLGQTGRGEPRYDLIASQPSHPWVSGAANLFTREFMAVVRDRLSERGLFAMWINTFRADRDSLLAIAASFEEIFPGSFVFISNEQRGRTSSVMLIGGRSPLRVDAAAVRERMAASELGRALRLLHGFDGFEALMTLAEAPTSAYAQLAGELRNTDDNALVEMRAPRLALASGVDLEALESSLPADTPVLPPLGGSVAAADVAARILDLARGQQPWPFAHRLERLLRTAAQEIEPLQREVLAARIALGDEQRESAAIARLRDLADRYPERPEALRALGRHLFRAGRLAEAADALAPAYARAPSARAAYEVGRALEPQSLQGAREWYRRIPAEARSEFPRLAVSEARWALSEGAPAELLRPQLERLLAYRATREGRSEPDLGGLIAKLAHGVGDELLAARFEAPGARPVHPGWKAEFDAALSAFARRDVEATEQSLARARKLAPGNRPVLQLAAASAARRGDASALAATFASLRDYAPTLEAGIRAENEVRARIGMPLLPMLAAERSVESLRER